uniref:Xaa-Pro dipeptidase n=1 Tax=Setaria digitata TaxID=48799 RepID=A0A915Q8B2_9BILA
MSAETLTIAAKLFVENRKRLVKMLKNKVQEGSVVLLKGGVKQNRYNTDAMDLAFRQESYFFWTFGVHESNFFGAIDVDSGKSFLFPPRLHPDYAIWEGKINGEEWYRRKYEVDEVHFNDKNTILKVLTNLRTKQLLLLRAENSDSNEILEPPIIFELSDLPYDTSILYPIMAELRVFKTDYELDVIRYTCQVASNAHKATMKATKPGIYEYQLESGCNGAILHYGHESAPNKRKLVDGDLCLFDMGPEYNCYASDITTTFPCNGKFTEKQKIIYNAVLAANIEAFKAAKPGVRWTSIHNLAERIILSHLRDAAILRGDLDKMMEASMGAVFMPHGLGHFMGLDVHDCGGYLGDAEPRSTLPGLKCLRTTRTLQERMVITIEPGCYFIDTLLDAALSNPTQKNFIVKEKLDEFRGFGGVRIEDDIVIWADGNERLSNVPRTVEEIEQFMCES